MQEKMEGMKRREIKVTKIEVGFSELDIRKK